MASPALPRTFRPRWGRWVPYAVALVLLAAAVLLALLVTSFAPADRILTVLLVLALVWVLHRLADVRVVAREEGLEVVNVLGRRRLAWAEVLSLHLHPGEPWLVLDLSDGTSLSAMGVQGSEGDYAQRQGREIATLVLRYSTPDAP
ncbi:PH (Pleckstrin Homology) domain-containing protein [Motilibacter rhizosphaerae]|uniref:PH (Pleckstrin Homology) domain-containing protein n=1 Tax=Motilibacter rhizosphaerae TaxID=598652 RepID=A0A4Q7NSL2_9ACTN|nr:PH domain-containing protein [Motilibacter rhizosphaerae]RZS89362.1 PH (Pleckstrin Homology) domain-containing protein [Motilibacter rhizosphaerae]